MDKAIDSLLEIKQKHPNIILRMIALTDGEDNDSEKTPDVIVKRIIKNKIILDSFVVSFDCDGLKKITFASGGKCYCPTTINFGLKFFEIETILSVQARGEIDWAKIEEESVNFEKFGEKEFDTEGIKMVQSKELKKASVDAQ